MIDPSLIEILEYREEGYKPLLDFGSWRVALLNGLDELLPENIPWFQKHRDTDEAFVLLSGRCVLYAVAGEVPDGGPIDPDRVEAVDMESFKLYDVRRGVYHSHALEPGSSVLIVENRDTSDANSPIVKSDAALRSRTAELARGLWSRGGRAAS
jgi:hypothetical protein